jgi:hypothetical protein
MATNQTEGDDGPTATTLTDDWSTDSDGNTEQADETADQAGDQTADQTESGSDTQIDHDELPEAVPWEHDPTDHHEATVLPAKAGELIQLGGECSIFSVNLMYVVDGFDDYLDAVDARQIETPPSYKAIRETFTPLVIGHTCEADGGRLGITRELLETAIRLVTGGGRYRTDAVTIYVGDPHCFAVQHDGDVILVRGTGIDTFGQEPETAVDPEPHTISGFEIVEDSAGMRTALRTFVEQVVPHLDCELSGYAERVGSKHVFTTAAGDRVGIDSNNLRNLTPSFPATSEIVGTHTVEPDIGQAHEVEVPGVPNAPGETHRLAMDDPDMNDRVVVGHRVGHKAPQGGPYSPSTSADIRLSDGTTFRLYTYTAKLIEKTVAGESKQHVDIRRFDDPIAEYTIANSGFKPSPRYRTILDDEQ